MNITKLRTVFLTLNNGDSGTQGALFQAKVTSGIKLSKTILSPSDIRMQV